MKNHQFWLFLATVRCYKNVECHFFVATVLGLASDLVLVVVKIRFRCAFWIYWTLAFRKKLVPECNPSTPNISYQKGGWRGKCWKQPFCINELWTNKIHEFERSQNHFVPNVLSVKSFVYNLTYIWFVCQTHHFVHFFCAKEISSKKPSVFPSLGKKRFREVVPIRTIYFLVFWLETFWEGKAKGRRMTRSI